MGKTASERVVTSRVEQQTARLDANCHSDVTVVLLGAGRVATHLAPALVEAGYRLEQVWSRTEDSARMLAEPLGVSYTNSLDAVVPDADIYIACVADSALPALAERLVRSCESSKTFGSLKSFDTYRGEVHRIPLFLHTAGSVPMDIWRQTGAVHYGILYPLQTFSKERAVDMREVSLFIEASDDEAMTKTESLALRLSAKVFHADSKRRARLHVAAVFACNFVNAMYDAAHQLLAEDKIPFEVLLPLIDETAAKVHTLAPREAQTGPAVRGDVAVMHSHMEALAQDKELQGLYESISRLIRGSASGS